MKFEPKSKSQKRSLLIAVGVSWDCAFSSFEPQLTKGWNQWKLRNIVIPFNHVAFFVRSEICSRRDRKIKGFAATFIAIKIYIWSLIDCLICLSKKSTISLSLGATPLEQIKQQLVRLLFNRVKQFINFLREHSNLHALNCVKKESEKLLNQLKIYWIVSFMLCFEAF